MRGVDGERDKEGGIKKPNGISTSLEKKLKRNRNFVWSKSRYSDNEVIIHIYVYVT